MALENILFTGMAALFQGFFSLWTLFVFTIMAINIFGIIFWIVMIIDLVQRDFKNDSDKLTWTLIVVLTGWIGALIYYFNVKSKDKK